MKSIAIIGGGFAGTATAIHLLRASLGERLQLYVVEQRTRLGRGLAYSIWDDNYVLNVPAGNMSLYADEPDHFVHFCQQTDPAYGPASFISRRLFGDYIEQELQQAAKNSRSYFEPVFAEATAVRPQRQGGMQIEFANRPPLQVDSVVLATGHLDSTPPVPALSALPPHTYINDPWQVGAFDGFSAAEPVAIIGTGHTAVDVLFTLTGRYDARRVLMLSRHGLLSHPHRVQTRLKAPKGFPEFLDRCNPSVLSYARAIREQVRRGEELGVDWRDIIGRLRPYTAEIWQRLPVAERRRFLRRLVAYWDIHRHRLAPTAHHRLCAMIQRGNVEVTSARITDCRPCDDGVQLLLKAPQDQNRTVVVKRVINCTGPNYDLSRSARPLFRQLLGEGHVRADPLRIGLDMAADYGVIGRDGRPATAISYIGPMLKARYWEAIAVPELRVHAQLLANRLAAECRTPAAEPGLEAVTSEPSYQIAS